MECSRAIFRGNLFDAGVIHSLIPVWGNLVDKWIGQNSTVISEFGNLFLIRVPVNNRGKAEIHDTTPRTDING